MIQVVQTVIVTPFVSSIIQTRVLPCCCILRAFGKRTVSLWYQLQQFLFIVTFVIQSEDLTVVKVKDKSSLSHSKA